jgi:hypothetical protein
MDGSHGYNPKNLIIVRFALTEQQIDNLKLVWIDNLITGNKNKRMDLADPKHKQHHLPHVQNWLKNIGRRKVESNALVIKPNDARKIYEDAILFGDKEDEDNKWDGLGVDALNRFAAKRAKVLSEIRNFRATYGIDGMLRQALQYVNGEA